jgi:hypothetical protein
MPRPFLQPATAQIRRLGCRPGRAGTSSVGAGRQGGWWGRPAAERIIELSPHQGIVPRLKVTFHSSGGPDMPTVTIDKPVSLEDAAKAVQDKLGSRYEVTTRGSEELKVKQSAATTATVHVSRDANATTFDVHGGGLVITRMINEMGIAKKVAETIKDALGGTSGGGSQP